jgi:hypothetical protein
MPGAPPGIGFDELRLSAVSDDLEAIVVPAGRTGNVNLIDPASGKVTTIGGFSSDATYRGASDFGVTSAEAGFDGLFVVDRTSKKLFLVDPVAKKPVGSVALAGAPESVRSFAPLRQIWVTEPEKEQIEIFSAGSEMQAAYSTGHIPTREASVATKGRPRSLVFDLTKNRAYTLLHPASVLSIEPFDAKVVGTWQTGCQEARALDVDQRRGLIFVGCAEGKVVALDAAAGAPLGAIDAGPSVDAIAYTDAPARYGHLYVVSAKSGKLSILGVAEKGELSMLGALPGAVSARCVTADKNGYVYVCDPEKGRILKVQDPYPPSR